MSSGKLTRVEPYEREPLPQWEADGTFGDMVFCRAALTGVELTTSPEPADFVLQLTRFIFQEARNKGTADWREYFGTPEVEARFRALDKMPDDWTAVRACETILRESKDGTDLAEAFRWMRTARLARGLERIGTQLSIRDGSKAVETIAWALDCLNTLKGLGDAITTV